MLAETCILFAGVVSRYVFDSPLMWTDELATFLFLWLAMVGAVVAVRRGGHMRLTTFVNWVGPNGPSWLATVGRAGCDRLRPRDPGAGRGISRGAGSTELITLQISDGYRVVAMLVGAGLIALVALLRLLETTTWRGFLLGAGRWSGAIAGGLWLAQPLLMAMGLGSLIVFFVVLVAVCVGIGVPIAFTFGIATSRIWR